MFFRFAEYKYSPKIRQIFMNIHKYLPSIRGKYSVNIRQTNIFIECCRKFRHIKEISPPFSTRISNAAADNYRYNVLKNFKPTLPIILRLFPNLSNGKLKISYYTSIFLIISLTFKNVNS